MFRFCTSLLTGIALISAPGLAAQEDAWAPISPMPTARESVAACSVNEHIYAVGGFPGGSDRGITTNERYDTVSNSWTTMAPMQTGRRMPVVAAVDGKCYVIGGRTTDGQTPLDVVEEYTPSTNSWRTRNSMPTRRYGHVGAVVGDRIYVIGGTDGNSLSRVVEVYTPASDSWESLSPMPTPRALPAAASHNGKIYVMGGTLDGVSQRYSRLEIYDPAADAWTTGSDMPSGKFSHQAQTANGRIYAFGGTTGPGALNDAAEYNPLTDRWRAVSSMSSRRARFASAVVDNRIYAIGGTISFGNPHVGMDLAEVYTPAAAESGFMINPGLNDAWYNPATPGQGFLISVFPALKQVFVAWFTYDTERPPENVSAILGDPGHRWITGQGPYVGDTASLTLFVTEGGVLDQAMPTPTTNAAGDGTLKIEFADCESAMVTYRVTSADKSGEIPIERIALDNVPLCELLATSVE